MTGDRGKLLIVGSIAFDTVETPHARVEKTLGGSASYALIAASYFADALAVGVVGEDFGEEHFERLRDHGVDLRGIERAPGKTFHWRGRYGENFKERETLETCVNVFEDFNPVLPEDYKMAEYIFLANINPQLQAKVLDQVRESKLVGLDTMNLWIRNSPDHLSEVMRRADVFFINDEEVIELGGKGTVAAAAEAVLGMGPKFLVVKRGEHGALLFGPGARLFVPAFLLPRVVDPTGAGDAFAGGFLGYLCNQESLDRRALKSALLAGTVMASFAIESFSVEGICRLKREDITDRWNHIEDMMG